MKRVSLRENMLITTGARAAYMECRGDISLPAGSTGEDELAEFIAETVDRYTNSVNMNFDEFIETALLRRFKKED